MRIVFMGTPEFAVPALEQLVLNRYQVVTVYTQPDKPAGRGLAPVSSPVKKTAEALGLPVMQPPSFRNADAVAQLAALRPDVVVVAAFGQLLPRAVLDIPKYGCINIHPSLLPRFRGASPVAAAILAGDGFTGVSIMLMDEGLDTGPVFVKAQIPVAAHDTTSSLMERLSLIAAHLLQEVLVRWPRGEIAPQPQNEADATYSGTFSKEEGRVDWHLPATDIWRRVRAFHPWPGCYTMWRGRQLKILEAMPLQHENMEAGRVVALDQRGSAFGVCTGEGVLQVLKVQQEGRKAMSAAEFLRGQREFVGAVLPS